MPGYCTDGSCLGAFHDSCFALSRVPRSAYICSHCVSGTVCARLCASDGILRLSSTAKWQDDFVYTKLYLALPFSMSNLRTDCQQVRAAEVSAGSVQMTVRRSAGVEAVKGSVRSAWYAKTVLSFAFGVEVALADEAECIGVEGRKCENGFEFRIRQRRGASRGNSCPLNSAFGEQDNGGGNAAGHARIAWQFGPRVLSCTSDFDRKKHRKSLDV